jgi:NAD(P)-dependent dehydrogenase (short-subunit alcohol dehydrogenase family)
MRLEGKRSLVTGAQQGIGRAAVLALARAGAHVAINWFEGQAAAEELAMEVRGLQRRAVTVQGDVSKSADVTHFVEEAHRALGGIDILINNAGVFPRSPFLELTEAEWDHVLDVNLKGSFLVAQAVARKMVTDGTKGAIVNISSSSVRGHVLGVHYSASKNGIIGITRSMALALAPHGIRVNAVAPGMVPTDMQSFAKMEAGEALKRMAATLGIQALQRMAAPDDIGAVVAFLASDEARWITGDTLRVDGGSKL